MIEAQINYIIIGVIAVATLLSVATRAMRTRRAETQIVLKNGYLTKKQVKSANVSAMSKNEFFSILRVLRIDISFEIAMSMISIGATGYWGLIMLQRSAMSLGYNPDTDLFKVVAGTVSVILAYLLERTTIDKGTVVILDIFDTFEKGYWKEKKTDIDGNVTYVTTERSKTFVTTLFKFIFLGIVQVYTMYTGGTALYVRVNMPVNLKSLQMQYKSDAKYIDSIIEIKKKKITDHETGNFEIEKKDISVDLTKKRDEAKKKLETALLSAEAFLKKCKSNKAWATEKWYKPAKTRDYKLKVAEAKANYAKEISEIEKLENMFKMNVSKDEYAKKKISELEKEIAELEVKKQSNVIKEKEVDAILKKKEEELRAKADNSIFYAFYFFLIQVLIRHGIVTSKEKLAKLSERIVVNHRANTRRYEKEIREDFYDSPTPTIQEEKTINIKESEVEKNDIDTGIDLSVLDEIKELEKEVQAEIGEVNKTKPEVKEDLLKKKSKELGKTDDIKEKKGGSKDSNFSELEKKYLLFVDEYYREYGRVPGRKKVVKELGVPFWKAEDVIRRMAFLFSGEKTKRMPNNKFYDNIEQLS